MIGEKNVQKGKTGCHVRPLLSRQMKKGSQPTANGQGRRERAGGTTQNVNFNNPLDTGEESWGGNSLGWAGTTTESNGGGGAYSRDVKRRTDGLEVWAKRREKRLFSQLKA